MTSPVRIVEVGPRDGLQNEPRLVTTASKLALVEQLTAAGLREIEVTASVSRMLEAAAARVPQLTSGGTA